MPKNYWKYSRLMRASGRKVNRDKKKKKNLFFQQVYPQDMQILIKDAIGVPLYITMKNISICHPLWAIKRSVLTTLSSGYGKNCKAERVSFYLKQVEKF